MLFIFSISTCFFPLRSFRRSITTSIHLLINLSIYLYIFLPTNLSAFVSCLCYLNYFSKLSQTYTYTFVSSPPFSLTVCLSYCPSLLFLSPNLFYFVFVFLFFFSSCLKFAKMSHVWKRYCLISCGSFSLRNH